MQFNTDKLLFFDIETVSQLRGLYEMSEESLTMWMKYRETFLKKITNHERLEQEKLLGERGYNEEIYRQTSSFFPEFGKVSCVSMGFIRKGEYNYESFYGDNEIDILTQVRDIFNKVETMGYDLCGQNIKFFDIPFLGKRYFINGLIPPTLFPRHNTKPWELRVLDTKDIWQFGNNWSLSSLDLQCLSLGLDSPKNGDVKGDNVTENHWNGEYKKISEYCEKDVKSLMDIITKLNELE